MGHIFAVENYEKDEIKFAKMLPKREAFGEDSRGNSA